MQQNALSFGQPEGPAEPLWSVTTLNLAAKQLLERRFASVRVQGEISNYRPDRSGHRYFVLKDRSGNLSAAMFRSAAAKLRFAPADGLLVTATGQLTIYGERGRYQLVVSALEAAGEGALQALMLALKAKLEAEGLFASARKRRLPKLPRRVAVLTSAEGAVWRDMVHVATRRFGRPPLLLVPTRVQGQAAVDDLLASLALVRAHHQALGIDVVVLARGGGSLEDLAAFNSEPVARALADMPMPTVSAVGHETDVSISDFVADVRAPTPSAAAELIFGERAALLEQLRQQRQRLGRAVESRLKMARLKLTGAGLRLGDGRALVWPRQDWLADRQRRLERTTRHLLATAQRRLTTSERKLAPHAPARRLAALGDGLRRLRAALVQATKVRLARERQALARSHSELRALSPLSVLGRGYALLTLDDGSVVRRAEQVRKGDRLTGRLAQGVITATVTAAAAAREVDGPRQP